MSTTPNKSIRIGLAGLGNVGAGVFKNLERNRQLLTERTGVSLEVARVAVRDWSKPRDVEVAEDQRSQSWRELVDDDSISIIVELIGGTTEARDLVTAALKAKKAVVTGNKALLAEHGHELIALSEAENVPLYFEAAVAGGIPIIKAIREALVGNQIQSIYGIINGTSNYILTRMATAGLQYPEALKEAQDLGYAEADPALDVNGWDAGHKAIILAWLSYGLWVRPEEISVDGVENVMPADIKFADTLGYAIKMLAVIKLDDQNRVEVRVQPSLVPKKHILAWVNDVFNAIAVHGDIVGETLFYGSGAGQDATSSSVISDLADAAANVIGGSGCNGFAPHGFYGEATPIDETESSYYLRLRVADEHGVIAQISKIIAAHNIGISSVVQPGTGGDTHVDLMLMTHAAPFGEINTAIEELAALSCVAEKPVLMRVETLGC